MTLVAVSILTAVLIESTAQEAYRRFHPVEFLGLIFAATIVIFFFGVMIMVDIDANSVPRTFDLDEAMAWRLEIGGVIFILIGAGYFKMRN